MGILPSNGKMRNFRFQIFIPNKASPVSWAHMRQYCDSYEQLGPLNTDLNTWRLVTKVPIRHQPTPADRSLTIIF